MRRSETKTGCGSSSPGCNLGRGVVDRAAVEPRRRAGFETRAARSPAAPSAPLMPAVVPSPARPPGVLRFAGVHQGLQKRAGGEHHRAGAIDRIAAHRARRRSALRPSCRRLLDQQVFDHFLPQRQVGLLFDEPLDFLLIGFFVGLGPRAVHGRPFAAIEQAELDAGGVDGPAHRPAQGVDLADDLPLGHAADGRIAAHLADRVAIGGQQGGARRRRAAANAASVPAWPAPMTSTSNS